MHTCPTRSLFSYCLSGQDRRHTSGSNTISTSHKLPAPSACANGPSWRWDPRCAEVRHSNWVVHSFSGDEEESKTTSFALATGANSLFEMQRPWRCQRRGGLKGSPQQHSPRLRHASSSRARAARSAWAALHRLRRGPSRERAGRDDLGPRSSSGAEGKSCRPERKSVFGEDSQRGQLDSKGLSDWSVGGCFFNIYIKSLHGDPSV